MQATFNVIFYHEWDKNRTGYTEKQASVSVCASPETIEKLINTIKEIPNVTVT